MAGIGKQGALSHPIDPPSGFSMPEENVIEQIRRKIRGATRPLDPTEGGTVSQGIQSLADFLALDDAESILNARQNPLEAAIAAASMTPIGRAVKAAKGLTKGVKAGSKMANILRESTFLLNPRKRDVQKLLNQGYVDARGIVTGDGKLAIGDSFDHDHFDLLKKTGNESDVTFEDTSRFWITIDGIDVESPEDLDRVKSHPFVKQYFNDDLTWK